MKPAGCARWTPPPTSAPSGAACRALSCQETRVA
jgi:hypothetical protein